MPVIVTDVPEEPDVVDKLEMLGFVGVNEMPLLSTPLTRTTTLPVVAPEGTLAKIAVLVQINASAVVPLNLTVLLP